jgi:hypothetical protein
MLMIFNGFLSIFGRFNPFLEDLGPFLRPNIGGEVGSLFPTSCLYKIEVHIRKMMINY